MFPKFGLHKCMKRRRSNDGDPITSNDGSKQTSMGSEEVHLFPPNLHQSFWTFYNSVFL